MANPFLGALAPAEDHTSAALRLLGVLVFVGLTLALLRAVFPLGFLLLEGAGPVAPFIAVAALVVLVLALFLHGTALYWITYARRAWGQGLPGGSTHTAAVGLLAMVLGTLLVAAGLLRAASADATGGGLGAMELLRHLVYAGYAVVGAWLLVVRGRALGGAPSPAT